MFSFEEQYELAQEITGLTDSVNLVKFKRYINRGGTIFMAALNRPINRKGWLTDIVASQQYYQFGEDVVRATDVTYDDGSTRTPLIQVPDEMTWNALNQTTVSGNPTRFYIRGADEIGLYPIPSASVVGGLKASVEPKHLKMTEADFTDGTLAVTEGSRTITHSGTGFTASMVGRKLIVEDGSDGRSYRISAYVSSSVLTLENYYQGATNSTVANGSWRIGQVMNIPDEYLEAPVDYAMHRFWLIRGDRQKSSDFKALFTEAKTTAKSEYGRATSSAVIDVRSSSRRYNPLTDTPNAIPT